MAHALGIARDSIIGYWDADPEKLKDPRTIPDPDTLKYLTGAHRFEILLGELLSQFQVYKTESGASVAVKGASICTIATPSIDQLKEQMIWVRNYADLRGDRIAEITEQTGNIIAFFGSVGLINETRRKATWELLSLVQSVCLVVQMRLKHFCWSPRPIDFAEEVHPVIQTPDHSTFPSGHATEAFALATVLYHLMQKGDRLAGHADATPPMAVRVAHRIAVNRTVAGVHFPTDSAAGAMLGTAIGEAIIALATGTLLPDKDYGTLTPALGTGDFTQKWFMDNHAGAAGPKVTELDLFSIAYGRAESEW